MLRRSLGGVRGVRGSALTLVQLLHGQSGERENADADQDQQGGEEGLKHGVLLGELWGELWGELLGQVSEPLPL
ncbi:hypothetical protein GCM10010277_51430 [Streptomyces longisporoflavus]|nr:hypothetical protein GCM10010277_51430 [Streptomyces longisporoflavus]